MAASHVDPLTDILRLQTPTLCIPQTGRKLDVESAPHYALQCCRRLLVSPLNAELVLTCECPPPCAHIAERRYRWTLEPSMTYRNYSCSICPCLYAFVLTLSRLTLLSTAVIRCCRTLTRCDVASKRFDGPVIRTNARRRRSTYGTSGRRRVLRPAASLYHRSCSQREELRKVSEAAQMAGEHRVSCANMSIYLTIRCRWQTSASVIKA